MRPALTWVARSSASRAAREACAGSVAVSCLHATGSSSLPSALGWQMRTCSGSPRARSRLRTRHITHSHPSRRPTQVPGEPLSSNGPVTCPDRSGCVRGWLRSPRGPLLRSVPPAESGARRRRSQAPIDRSRFLQVPHSQGRRTGDLRPEVLARIGADVKNAPHRSSSV